MISSTPVFTWNMCEFCISEFIIHSIPKQPLVGQLVHTHIPDDLMQLPLGAITAGVVDYPEGTVQSWVHAGNIMRKITCVNDN